MPERVAAIITNYNMPERADALAESILKSSWPVDLYLVDNGSDLVEPAKHTTHRIEKNCQTTGGWIYGWEQAKKKQQYLAYFFIITSAEVVQGDPIARCAELLLEKPDAVGVHPALSSDSTTAWNHLKYSGAENGGCRQTWMIDNIFSCYRADWFPGFDPALIYAHGIDLETCYKARREKKTIWIHEGAQVRKITDIGYTMNRMNMSAQERRDRAFENMKSVLEPRYGPDWWKVLTQ